MEKVKKIVSDILAKHKVNTVYYVGCGGSLSGFFPGLNEKVTSTIHWHR